MYYNIALLLLNKQIFCLILFSLFYVYWQINKTLKKCIHKLFNTKKINKKKQAIKNK
jgi:hypothetical protein